MELCGSLSESLCCFSMFYSSSMESRGHFRLPPCLKLTIWWLFFAGIVSCTQNSRKYIMKSYFDMYDSLQDSTFQDFLQHVLVPSSFCQEISGDLNLLVGLSVTERSLIGEGSHRRLTSSIRLQVEPDSVSKLGNELYHVIVVERLPLGVFADPFELEHLQQKGAFAGVSVFGDTNLELPSFRSNRSVVEIHMDVAPNVLLEHKNGLEIGIQIPLHARYPPLTESGYSVVKFGEPDLFLSYTNEGKQHSESCLFMSPTPAAESKTGVIVWKIPSGIKSHAEFVSIATFTSALLATLFIVLTSIFCSGGKVQNILKQS